MPIQPSRVDRSPWSVWATLWHSLEQRSSWPKLPPPAFKHAGLETRHAVVKPYPDRLRCFSKHGLPNHPGWQLTFSGRSEQHSHSRLSNALADPGFKRASPDTSSLPAGSTEAAFTVHVLFRRKAWSRPTLQRTEHLGQTYPLLSLAAVFESKHTAGKERLNFGERLGDALGAAGSVQWTAGLVCNSDTACLRMLSKLALPLWNHATPDRLRCFSTHAPSKQAGLTVDLLWSIGATL